MKRLEGAPNAKRLTQQKTLEARFSSNWPMMILTSLSWKKRRRDEEEDEKMWTHSAPHVLGDHHY